MVRISVRGIVQGVGFRPYIYQLAHKYSLKGRVSNTSEDVKIEVTGEVDSLEAFLDDLPLLAPPRAVIEDISVTRSLSVKKHRKLESQPPG